ncbi:Gfo/Idh/MocA family oxidoreductase [Vibrio sp. SCSIO 43136]|uniref:Gfo/Idh/MocA family protein n=1 Tax=Vibrio sp. SCSIO 43136 TaxID=2819101 RepID=UPI0020754221|nr:Gfo/Idh/MocA family oxidoreductase [Vibrio sp. SCSIO 43136]USD67452.1 Gfo/Idh/MocA family oxidoreductase [Vibrio sp. SCSIO 43136]
MTHKEVKVLVYGTGFAGQGHTKAFRDAGATVVGIVGRTESVVNQVANELDIPFASTDWGAALNECQPDIVSIATPGGAHVEPIKLALENGCHVFCDKPLCESGELSVELRDLAHRYQRKTAFASSFRYMPEIMHAKQLVAEGVIGEPTEVECISHFNLDKNIPFGWSHRAEHGGGRLNNNFTHLLSIVTSIVGENILSVCGEVRDDLRKAPIVAGVHNFTQRRNFIPEDINDPNLEWGESNVEWSYTVMASIESRLPAKAPVSVLFKHGGLTPRFDDDHITIHGTEGSIYIKGHYGAGPLQLWTQHTGWNVIELPNHIRESLPAIEDDTQRSWSHLATQLVKDVCGEVVEPYQTFDDGCRYQQIIDIIRENNSWVDVHQL